MFKALNTEECNAGGATTKSDCFYSDPGPPTDRSGKSRQEPLFHEEIPAGQSMTQRFPSVPGRMGRWGDVTMIRDLLFWDDGEIIHYGIKTWI